MHGINSHQWNHQEARQFGQDGDAFLAPEAAQCTASIAISGIIRKHNSLAKSATLFWNQNLHRASTQRGSEDAVVNILLAFTDFTDILLAKVRFGRAHVGEGAQRCGALACLNEVVVCVLCSGWLQCCKGNGG
jgi:hypothetical protein